MVSARRGVVSALFVSFKNCITALMAEELSPSQTQWRENGVDVPGRHIAVAAPGARSRLGVRA